ncbi:sigma factor-like helix-turn-helix DNA-binding protein [Rhizobium sp. AB2/73]|uniref:sigma factor-like helix-turn-helix DNA-binding protein n=1 Tax=Rhizobium sp. AB2/73 TaxID=2795216 RepID=UPI0035B01C1B
MSGQFVRREFLCPFLLRQQITQNGSIDIGWRHHVREHAAARVPEPLVEPLDAQEAIADDVTVTLMLALERLSPLERAAFLLHEVFDVALTEVAVVLHREPATVRQLASRARKNVQNARPRYSVGAAEADGIARAFFCGFA